MAHYAGGTGCMVLAGGPWGVIRAVTAGITQCLSSVATSPGRGRWRRGQVMAGKFWTLAGSYWVFWRARVIWDWAEGTGRVGLPELIISTVQRGPLYFWKSFKMA